MKYEENDSENMNTGVKNDWHKNLDRDSFEYQARSIWEKYSRKIKIGLATTGVLIGLASSVYIVPGGSEGVVKTFGKYTSTSKEGPHMKIPFVQSVTKVNTDKVYEEVFGYRTAKSDIKSGYIGTDDIIAEKVDESTLIDIIEAEGYEVEGNPAQQATNILREEHLMLTGDLNMADIEYSVQYKIVDPVAYLFNVRNSKKMIRDYAQSCTKTVIGDVSIDEALTIGRTMIGTRVKEKMNEQLAYNKSGLQIIVYKLQSGNPPREVRESFRQVNNAIAQKQTKINNAMGEYNEKISKAQGTVDGMISEAEGDAIKIINDAQGDVNLFRPVYNEFKKNPEITTSRIIMETYNDMLKGTKNTVDLTNQNNGLLLKHLNINENTGDAK